jgi:hypothetical protein
MRTQLGAGCGSLAVTTQADITQHYESGSWRSLAELAARMVSDAEQHAKSKLDAHLGGGTRLMLALQHRISHDVDLFIRDPQWLGYLTPRLNDRFEHLIDAYEEGSSSLKLRLPEGEIDFIVSMDLLDLPPETLQGCEFKLEPVAEVLAKKLFYRGWSLTPRDLFDWWSIGHSIEATHIPRLAMAKLLKQKSPAIHSVLEQIKNSPQIHAHWERILAPNKPVLSLAADWAQTQLAEYQNLLA